MLAAVLLVAPAGSAATGPKLRITPISAVFVQSELATRYTVKTVGAAPKGVTYTWTLKLTLVDPAGAPAPEAPDAHAAVDPTCDNAELPGGKRAGRETFSWKGLGGTFTWYHGDKGSYPDGYGCDHRKMGPKGHQGIVSVLATGGDWSCTASIRGTNGPVGPAAHCVRTAASTPETTAATTTRETTTEAATTTATPTTTPAETTTPAPTTTATGGSSGGGFPIWIPIVGGLIVLGGGGAWLRASRAPKSADECADLVARCRELRAAVDEAVARSAAAEAEAKGARAEHEKAEAARQSAQKAADAADHPDEGSSWVRDDQTGEVVTEHDLALEQADGGSHWGDPAYRKQLREQEKAKAHAALDAAKQVETAAKAAADRAAGAAKAAADAVARARVAADAACKAADDCLEAAAVAKKKAAEEAAAEAKRKAAEEAARRAKEAASHPPAVATPPPPPQTVERPECEDGCEPDVQTESVEVQMYLLSAADVKIDQVFQFSPEDVDEALEGFEKFSVIVKIGEFAEGFAESGGDFAAGEVGVHAALNTIKGAVNQGFALSGHLNLINPQAASESTVVDALKKLIAIVNRKRALGTWTMRCPLVKVRATCEKVRECRGGRWVVTGHTFTLEYGQTGRYATHSLENQDGDDPEGGAVETRTRLLIAFNTDNTAARGKLERFAERCARS